MANIVPTHEVTRIFRVLNRLGNFVAKLVPDLALPLGPPRTFQRKSELLFEYFGMGGASPGLLRISNRWVLVLTWNEVAWTGCLRQQVLKSRKLFLFCLFIIDLIVADLVNVGLKTLFLWNWAGLPRFLVTCLFRLKWGWFVNESYSILNSDGSSGEGSLFIIDYSI